MTDLLLLLVLLAPLLGGLLAWPARGRVADLVALVAGVLTLVPAALLAVAALGDSTVTGLGGIAVVDAFGGLTLLVVCLVATMAMAGSPRYLRHADAQTPDRPTARGRYWALLLWFGGALLAVPLVDNLGLVWVGIEAATIVAAMLVGFARTPEAIEAAWKSLILGSVGIGFALLGTMLAYASSVDLLGETSDALAWTRLTAVAGQLDPGLMRLAFIFVLVGYGTKTGLVPFHTWLPDAHSQAPSPVSALLSGASLAVALYALARFQAITAGAVGPDLPSTLLIAFGLLSLAVALPFIAAQDDLKRLLAYSSIEHMGVAALALGFGGAIALGGLVLHLVAHGLVKGSLFLSGGGIVEAGESRRILHLSGSLRRVPADGWGFLAGSLLLCGLPPSALFVSELAIVLGGVQQGWGVAAALAAVLLALTAAGFLFHVARVTWGRPRRRPRHVGGETGPMRGRAQGRLATAWPALIGTPLAIVAVLGVWLPTPFAAAVGRVVSVLGVPGG
ncbi:MAG: proton-conducting transporter membrane subunit [Chloroflexota bacterium]